MATYVTTQYPDNQSLPNFLAWAGNTSSNATTTGSLVLTSVATSVGPSAVYTGTITGGASNAYFGFTFVIAGFLTAANNGTFLCTASTGTTLTLTTSAAVAETHAATASGTVTGTFHGLSFALSTFGWTQTADTGQVNWATIATVPASTTYVYEVWKMADSLAGAFPVYLKIEYGHVTNAPSIAYTVSTSGTDGAGNLNAPKSTRNIIGSYTSTGAETALKLDLWFSGDSGSFRTFMFIGGGAVSPYYYQPFMLVISRTNDASGNRVGTGVIAQSFSLANASITPDQQFVFNSSIGGVGNRETAFFIGALPQSNTTTITNGAILITPTFVNVGGLSNPTPDLFIGKNNDFATDEVIQQFPVYGTQHTYLVHRNTGIGTNYISGIPSSLLMRYE